MKIKKVACYSCGGHIEYDIHSNIQECLCPHCNLDILFSACEILPTYNTRCKLAWATIFIVILAILIGGVMFFGKNPKNVAISTSTQPVQSISPELLPVFSKNILLLPDFQGTNFQGTNINVVLIPHKLPSKEESEICNKILVELLMINKSLEIGTSYNRFAQLIQDQALAVERIKLTEQVPTDFSFHAERVINSYRSGLGHWSSAIEAEGDHKTLCEDFRSVSFASANMDLEYMKAIVGKSTPDAIIEKYLNYWQLSNYWRRLDSAGRQSLTLEDKKKRITELFKDKETLIIHLYSSYETAPTAISGYFHHK